MANDSFKEATELGKKVRSFHEAFTVYCVGSKRSRTVRSFQTLVVRRVFLVTGSGSGRRAGTLSVRGNDVLVARWQVWSAGLHAREEGRGHLGGHGHGHVAPPLDYRTLLDPDVDDAQDGAEEDDRDEDGEAEYGRGPGLVTLLSMGGEMKEKVSEAIFGDNGEV